MRRFPGAACCLLLASLPCPAIAQLLGPEFQVNTYTYFFQGSPSVAAADSGEFVVVWNSVPQPQDDAYGGVAGQRFDRAGVPVGVEFHVNAHTTGEQGNPAVSVHGASGGFVVVWQSEPQDGSLDGIFGQRFDAAGLPLGGEFRVNTYTTGEQSRPRLAVAGSGGFVVVWQSNGQESPEWGVFGQRYDSSGVPQGIEFQVNTVPSAYPCWPAVAADGSGSFVVVWHDWGHDGSESGVFGRRYDATGVPEGGAFQVNTYTTDRQSLPSVAVGATGDFVVTWNSYLQDGSPISVFGRRYDAAGFPLGEEFRVNAYTPSLQSSSRVATAPSGDFLVTWSSYDEDGSYWGVFGQRFDAQGVPIEGELQINSYTTNNQSGSAVTADGAGNFVVVWASDYQDDPIGSGVFGRQVRVSLFTDGFEAGDACAWSVAVGGGCPLVADDGVSRARR